MFMAEIKDQKGLSLVEILITMSVILIGVMGAYSLLANVQITHTRTSHVVQAQQEARNIVEHIVRDLRESNLDQVWITSANGESDSITFYTPRDENGAFNAYHEVDDDGNPLTGYGKPVWRRTVAYSLDPRTNYLYRYQSSELISDIDEMKLYSEGEIVSKSVKRVIFERVDNMITISIRTFEAPGSDMGYVAESHTDYYTKIEFRN